jgi:hypothetical protein
MKKTMMQLAVTGMVLACSQAVFAASLTSVLLVMDTNGNGIPINLSLIEGGIHANGHGYVTFNATRGGGCDVTVQLWDAAKSYTYLVFYERGAVKPPFTTDKKGNGGIKFHVNQVSEFAPSGWIVIFSAKPEVPPLWCARNPLVP